MELTQEEKELIEKELLIGTRKNTIHTALVWARISEKPLQEVMVVAAQAEEAIQSVWENL